MSTNTRLHGPYLLSKVATIQHAIKQQQAVAFLTKLAELSTQPPTTDLIEPSKQNPMQPSFNIGTSNILPKDAPTPKLETAELPPADKTTNIKPIEVASTISAEATLPQPQPDQPTEK